MTSRIVRRWRARAAWTAAAAMTALVAYGFAGVRASAGGDPPNTGMADPAALVRAYDRFVAAGAPANVVALSLSNLRGISSEAMNAGGKVLVDLAAGTVASSVELLPPDQVFDLWLIDNRAGPGRTTLAEAGDAMLKVGPYVADPGGHTLAASPGPAVFSNFFPDRAFVVRTGTSPLDGFVLTGPSSFFARLQHRQVRFEGAAGVASGFDPAAPATRLADMARVVAEGRDAFLDETFDGNGRTCGTCHVEANNFTIDPALIATLPANDALFVAETNPSLAALERPDLMRRFGLFLVNADGFDPSRRFVFRGTQNVQALANSMTAPDPLSGADFSINGRNPNPPERLGWGNDGPPLRDFALVAIAQHATSTLSRTPRVDFRVPTDEELDALAAYQLSLGREEDFELATLTLRSPLASRGRMLFMDSGNVFQPGHKNCNGCHFNGGGTSAIAINPTDPGFPRVDGNPSGVNIVADTKANEIPLALTVGLPRDGGFGQILTAFGSFGNDTVLPEPFGRVDVEDFNAPPVVESADTGPFFHNHTIADLESAVAFYGSPVFKASLSAVAVPVEISGDPEDPDVQAIAAFLRVLNALENIRSSIAVAERGRTMPGAADRRELATLALAETIDASQVLAGGALSGQKDPAIRSARARLLAARAALEVAQRLGNPAAIENLLHVALDQLRGARTALVNPATLPQTFRN